MTSERPPERPLLARLYAPLATAALVLGPGNLLASRVPRAQSSTPEERARLVETCVRAETPRWLYLGHSQTSSIPELRPGDQPVGEVLEALERAAPNATPVPVCSLSLGSMNMAEGFALLAGAGERHPSSVRIALTSVALDQLRSVALREEVAEQIVDPQIRERLRVFVAAQTDLPDAALALDPYLRSRSGEPAAASPAPTLAERTEASLQRAAEHIPLFARREDMRRAVSLAYVTARNRLLHISSATSRPVADTTYRAGMQLLELSLRYARDRRVPLVIYVAPFRPRQPRPFPEASLAKLRADTRELCARYGATCPDYLDLVPDGLYSVYPPGHEGLDGQPDFAHLTGPAHRILAARLLEDLAPLSTMGGDPPSPPPRAIAPGSPR